MEHADKKFNWLTKVYIENSYQIGSCLCAMNHNSDKIDLNSDISSQSEWANDWVSTCFRDETFYASLAFRPKLTWTTKQATAMVTTEH